MKSLLVLSIVLALVAGVAVNGSRAQTIQSTSVAFNQCRDSTMSPDRCRSLGQFDQPAPAWLVEALVYYVFGEVLDYLINEVIFAPFSTGDHSTSGLFGNVSTDGCIGNMPCQRPESPTASIMFDPVRAGNDLVLDNEVNQVFVVFAAFGGYDADGCAGLRPCLDPDGTDTATTRAVFDPVQ